MFLFMTKYNAACLWYSTKQYTLEYKQCQLLPAGGASVWWQLHLISLRLGDTFVEQLFQLICLNWGPQRKEKGITFIPVTCRPPPHPSVHHLHGLLVNHLLDHLVSLQLFRKQIHDPTIISRLLFTRVWAEKVKVRQHQKYMKKSQLDLENGFNRPIYSVLMNWSSTMMITSWTASARSTNQCQCWHVGLLHVQTCACVNHLLWASIDNDTRNGGNSNTGIT